jgi:hypothetical protein
MADTFQFDLSFLFSIGALGSFNLTPPSQTGTPYYEEKNIVLANGDNTITCPTSNHSWILILFDSTSVNNKKLKGIGGDTGILLKLLPIALLGSPGSAATFIINSAGLDLNPTRILFF